MLLSPVQAFLEERHQGHWHGSYVEFVPSFFAEISAGFLRLDDFEPLLVGRSYHLWFLIFLLWFAVLGLPVFLALGSRRGGVLVHWIARRSQIRGWIILFAVPIALVHVAFRAKFPEEHDWGEFGYYFPFFVVGYVGMSDERFLVALRRDDVPLVCLGLIGFVALIGPGVVDRAEQWLERPTYSWAYAFFLRLFSIQAWCWAAAAFGTAMRVRSFERRMPQHLADVAMPFFLLHQPAILAIAYFVVNTNLDIWPKLVIVLVASLVSSWGLAALLSRNEMMRRLLGTKAPLRLSK